MESNEAALISPRPASMEIFHCALSRTFILHYLAFMKEAKNLPFGR